MDNESRRMADRLVGEHGGPNQDRYGRLSRYGPCPAYGDMLLVLATVILWGMVGTVILGAATQ